MDLRLECQNKYFLVWTSSSVNKSMVVPGEYVGTAPKRRIENTKNEFDKWAMKLNYIKLDIGVIV